LLVIVDYESCAKDLLAIVKTKDGTVFLAFSFCLLKPGG